MDTENMLEPLMGMLHTDAQAKSRDLLRVPLEAPIPFLVNVPVRPLPHR